MIVCVKDAPGVSTRGESRRFPRHCSCRWQGDLRAHGLSWLMRKLSQRDVRENAWICVRNTGLRSPWHKATRNQASDRDPAAELIALGARGPFGRGKCVDRPCDRPCTGSSWQRDAIATGGDQTEAATDQKSETPYGNVHDSISMTMKVCPNVTAERGHHGRVIRHEASRS